MKINNLSVFFPAYNEEDNIVNTLTKAVNFLTKKKINYELIVVDDGSADNTGQEVKKLASKNSRIKLIVHKKNKGYGAALKTGMREAKYEWVCFTDSDGQFDLTELKTFFNYVGKFDLIVGYRKQRQDNAIRRLFARLLQLGDFVLFGVWLKDIDCGFKLFKKEVVNSVWPLVTESAITETEFMVRAKRAKYRIKEVGVTHLARLEGIQTGGQLIIISKAIKEALYLFWCLNIRKQDA